MARPMAREAMAALPETYREVLRLDSKNDGWKEGAPVLCRVKMINEFPLIPDLERLEAMLARELVQA